VKRKIVRNVLKKNEGNERRKNEDSKKKRLVFFLKNVRKDDDKPKKLFKKVVNLRKHLSSLPIIVSLLRNKADKRMNKMLEMKLNEKFVKRKKERKNSMKREGNEKMKNAD